MEKLFELDEDLMLINFGMEPKESDYSMLQWTYRFSKKDIYLDFTYCLLDYTISTVLYHKDELVYSTFETNLVEIKIRENLIIGKANKNGRSNF